jgi:hypothetical protein
VWEAQLRFDLKREGWKGGLYLCRQGAAVVEGDSDAARCTRHHVRVGEDDACGRRGGGGVKQK